MVNGNQNITNKINLSNDIDGNKNKKDTGNNVFQEVQNTQHKLSELFFDNLNSYYHDRKSLLRQLQILSFEAFIDCLKNGETEGFIKLPTGTGKTRLFCEFTKALNLPTIILVPRLGLVQDSYDVLVGNLLNGVGFPVENVCKISSNEGGTSIKQLEKYIESHNGEFKGVLVTTYQSLNTIRKSDELLFDFLVEGSGFIVSDEAHKSLGETTTETKDALFDDNITIEELEAEVIIEEELEGKIEGKVHLLTTATPKLINKDVRDNVKEIFSATMQEGSEAGDILIPRLESIGNALLMINNYDGNGSKLRIKDLSCVLSKYISETGNYIYEEIIQKYIDLKSINGEYLPGVGFCTTVEQVDFIVDYLNKNGIRAIRCTSSKSGLKTKNYNDIDAKQMLENDMVDLVITCTKVGEGWDVPTLRAALWFTPTESPVKNIQGNGRITRIITEEQEYIYRKNIGKRYHNKTNENTVIIEPNSWEINYQSSYNETSEGKNHVEGTSNEMKQLSTILGSHAMMYELGEISYDYLVNSGIDISLIKQRLSTNNLIKLHRLDLENEGIININTLLKYGGNKYINKFGYALIGEILGKTVKYPNQETLAELGIKLGFEFLTIDMITHLHKKDLREKGVYDMESLMFYGVGGYVKNYGKEKIQEILGKNIKYVTRIELQELGEKLGFEKIGIASLINQHKEELLLKNISDMETLLMYGPKKYEDNFGRGKAGKILSKVLRAIRSIELKELGEKLGFEGIIQKHKISLSEEGIDSMEGLLKYGTQKYMDTFGYKIIGEILGRSISYVNKNILKELGEKLGFNVNDSIENIDLSELIKIHKVKLSEEGITDCKSLVVYGAHKYKSNFGKRIVERIIHKNIKYITGEILLELGNKLGFESLIDIQKRELKEIGITNMQDLLSYGVVQYNKHFSNKVTSIILGKPTKPFNKTKLTEIGIKLLF